MASKDALPEGASEPDPQKDEDVVHIDDVSSSSPSEADAELAAEGKPEVVAVEGLALRTSVEGGGPRPAVEVGKERTVEDTAARLAFLLVAMFGITIVVHYVAMTLVLFFMTDEKRLEFVERIFNTVLPVISGLVGTTVAYYFGREKGRSGR